MQTEEVRPYYEKLSRKWFSLFVKRIFDFAVSSVMLAILSPALLVLAVMIKKDSEGPVFYRQERITQYGRKFRIYKFRTMVINADKIGSLVTVGEDPRITKMGKKLRGCRLDELPQLLNILKGDMSLVGPRPERPELQKEIEKEVPEFGLRLQAKAGLTGYAQVYGKYNTTFYDKLLMDLMYISKPSILEDFTIMLATVKILTSKESTEGVGEGKDKLEFRESK